MRRTQFELKNILLSLTCCLLVSVAGCVSGGDSTGNEADDTVSAAADAAPTDTSSPEPDSNVPEMDTASVDTTPEEDTAPTEDANFVPPENGPPLDNEMMEIDVNGSTYRYRLTVPTNMPDGPMPLILAFNGGGGNAYPFPQEGKFHQLAQTEGFIIAHPRSKLQPGNEGEWILNTGAISNKDINFVEAVIDDISSNYYVDAKRVYATGYSLGSMFSYEMACQLGSRFAAIASYAGTMPVQPASCDPQDRAAIMHIHGVEDPIIAYNNTWDWKEWDLVGTMMDIPSLILYWKDKYNCQTLDVDEVGANRHVVYSECDDNLRVEHHRLGDVDHEWPNSINGTSTHQIIWSFLSGFSKP